MADSRGLGADREADHAHPFLLAAFCLLTVVALGACAWPASAHADEALLPDAADDAVAESDLDPTDLGVAPIGAEPRGTQLASCLDAYLGEAFPASGVPGMAVAVIDSNGVRYERCLGDVGDADETFIIGSLSKSVTSVAIQQLVERGLVDLDAPVTDYVPECGTPADVTVRSLLNQTSGFGYYESLSRARSGESLGTFSYANANYDLLGRVVERVSGMGYADYLERSVFLPLGMADASVDGIEAPRAPEATGHRGWFGVPVADGFAHETGDDAWGGPASGYVRASVRDMERYLGMYLNSGAGALNRESVHRMVFSRVPDPDGDAFYGMGWTTFNWDDGELVMSHDGDVENYVARMCVIPGRDLAVVLLADANDAVEGNSTFWQMGDDVVSLAVGGQALGVDAAGRDATHVSYDAAYALALAACAVPLALLARWRRRWLLTPRDALARAATVAWCAFLHLGVPALVLSVPVQSGMRLRDFADFYPDQALVGLACAALLLAGGVAKLACALAARRQYLTEKPFSPATGGSSSRESMA